MTKKTPPEWKVAEVYKSPSGTIVRLTLANYPYRSAPWPKIGDVLVVKEKS